MLNIYNFKNRDRDGTVEDQIGKNNLPRQAGFIRYEDPNREFSSKELQMSLWYLKNKSLLYKISAAMLILINLGLIGFNVWQWSAFLAGYQKFQAVERSLVSSMNYAIINTHFAGQPVQVVRTDVLSGREGSYDVVSELVNPNERFLVRFDYYFVVNGKKTSVQKTFLLPGESRFAPLLGVKEVINGTPAIVLENIAYERISNRVVSDISVWQKYRLNFTVSDFVFVKSVAQDSGSVDAVQFTLVNNSPYNYVAPDFYVALLQYGQLVGVLPLHVERFNSLEVKHVDLRSFVPNLSVSDIAVYPVINIYDDTVYVP